MSANYGNAERLSRHLVTAAMQIKSKIARIKQEQLNDLPVDWRPVRQ